MKAEEFVVLSLLGRGPWRVAKNKLQIGLGRFYYHSVETAKPLVFFVRIKSSSVLMTRNSSSCGEKLVRPQLGVHMS
jgi:hypothetical protein